MSVDFVMPQMGETVADGTVTTWLAAIGDEVTTAEPICEVATDKIDSELHPPVDGVLTEILVHPGETVDVGVVLARIASDNAAVTPVGTHDDNVPGAAAAPPAAAPTASMFVPGPASGLQQGVGRLSPVVRRLSAEHGIDLGALDGTGPGGRITKRDVLEYVEHRASGLTVSSGGTQAMSTSTMAAVTQSGMVSIDVDYAAIDRSGQPAAARLGFVVFATCRANRRHPHIGGTTEPDMELDGRSLEGASGLRLPQLTAMVRGTAAKATTGSPVVIHDFTDASAQLNVPARAASTRVALAVQPISLQLLVEQSEVGYVTTASPRGMLVATYDALLVDHQSVSTWLGDLGQILETHDWSTEL